RRRRASLPAVRAAGATKEEEMIAPRATRLWKLKSRRSDHVKVTRLWLYPELECSSCVDDCDGNGEDQLAYYCEYIRTRYPQWWESDAVPIYWSVIGDGDGFGSETAVPPI